LLWPCGPPLNPDGTCTTGNGNLVSPFIKGAIEPGYWGGTALYDALEASLTKRFSHGFQVQGSYTWGKNIDTGSATTIADPYLNSISSMLWDCNACRRGLADFDIKHNFTVSYLWNVPTPNKWGTVGSHVLGGWELGGILTLHSGVPTTVFVDPDPLGQNNNDPLDYPDRVAGCNPVNTNFKKSPSGLPIYLNVNCFALPVATPAIAAQCEPFGEPAAPIAGTCSNLLGNAGRNTVIGPGFENIDFSLLKNNYVKKISENFNVQLRAEFFNLFNHANFSTLTRDTSIFGTDGSRTDGAGLLDNTTSPEGRQIQFALKIIW
jgi:hypothetical protein